MAGLVFQRSLQAQIPHSFPCMIHGSIFVLLKKFLESTGKETWIKVCEGAGINGRIYGNHENYPVLELSALVRSAAIHLEQSENETLQKFGEHLVADLLIMYSAYINPSWKTFEMLENTELVMHKAVRKQEINASPPVLHVSRVHDKLIIIDYYSKRRLASLAIGIIKGIAKYYQESHRVQVIPITNPQDERVQIRVEFN